MGTETDRLPLTTTPARTTAERVLLGDELIDQQRTDLKAGQVDRAFHRLDSIQKETDEASAWVDLADDEPVQPPFRRPNPTTAELHEG
jgi:hypothetical protein